MPGVTRAGGCVPRELQLCRKPGQCKTCVPPAPRGHGARPEAPTSLLAVGVTPTRGSTHLPLPALVLQVAQSISLRLLPLATKLPSASLLAFLPRSHPGGEKKNLNVLISRLTLTRKQKP